MSRFAIPSLLLAQVVCVLPAFAQFAPLPERSSEPTRGASPRLSSEPPTWPLLSASPAIPLEEGDGAKTEARLRATRPAVAARSVGLPQPSDALGQTPDEVYPWMFAVAKARPDRVRLLLLGQSSQGRSLWGLEIRPAGTTPTGKMTARLKRLAVICRQHGNEPEATVSGTRFAAQFLAASTPAARALGQKVMLLVVPIANPDGAAIYQRRTAQNIDMNRDWGHNHSVEVRALTQMVKWWKPQLLVDNHQWLPFEKMPPPMAEASGGKFARGVAKSMSQSNAARGFYLSARSRWGLDSLCHRYWGQRFGVPAILLETRHRPSVQGARDKAIAQALAALWAATKTLAG